MHALLLGQGNQQVSHRGYRVKLQLQEYTERRTTDNNNNNNNNNNNKKTKKKQKKKIYIIIIIIGASAASPTLVVKSENCLYICIYICIYICRYVWYVRIPYMHSALFVRDAIFP